MLAEAAAAGMHDTEWAASPPADTLDLFTAAKASPPARPINRARRRVETR
jgi:hypothetical protein